MRALFILAIVLITSNAVSPLLAADSMSPRPAININDPATSLKTPQQREVMTSQKMVKILIAVADESKALSHMVLLKYRGIELTCIYDVKHDRMRIITPIAARGNITNDQLGKAMEANFHTALDARYAFNKGILYAAYIHPLSTLTKAQLESALEQTATLAATFGKEYSSGSLIFKGSGQSL